jgi:hypothetical protein
MVVVQGQVKTYPLFLNSLIPWHYHIFTKRKPLGLTLAKMYWLLGRSSRLSLHNKLLLYKAILKPIWTYGIQFWGTASTSNIEILERFQSKALCIIVDAPWYVPNNHIRRDPPNDFRQRRNLPLQVPILHSPHHTSKWPNINPHGDSRQQAFSKARAKRSA